MKANWVQLERLEKDKRQEIEMHKEIEKRETEEAVTEKWKEEIRVKEEEAKKKRAEVTEQWKGKVKRI